MNFYLQIAPNVMPLFYLNNEHTCKKEKKNFSKEREIYKRLKLVLVSYSAMVYSGWKSMTSWQHGSLYWWKRFAFERERERERERDRERLKVMGKVMGNSQYGEWPYIYRRR